MSDRARRKCGRLAQSSRLRTQPEREDMENMTTINPAVVTEIAANTWTAEQEASASIMAKRKCSRIQAIHLHKRGNPDGILPHFAQSRTEPTERMAGFIKQQHIRLI